MKSFEGYVDLVLTKKSRFIIPVAYKKVLEEIIQKDIIGENLKSILKKDKKNNASYLSIWPETSFYKYEKDSDQTFHPALISTLKIQSQYRVLILPEIKEELKIQEDRKIVLFAFPENHLRLYSGQYKQQVMHSLIEN